MTQDLPPLAWLEPSAIGFTGNRSELSSFSRAARSLQALGLVDRAVTAIEPKYSENPFYRNARPQAHPDDYEELFQGQRWHLIVRAAATPLDRDSYNDASERLRSLPRRAKYRSRYQDWFNATKNAGVHPHDPGGNYIIPLPLNESLALIRSLNARRA